MIGSAAAMRYSSDIAWSTYLNQNKLDVYNYQQNQSNLWLNAFTSAINAGTSYLSRFWNP
jgi:hypothetical protein